MNIVWPDPATAPKRITARQEAALRFVRRMPVAGDRVFVPRGRTGSLGTVTATVTIIGEPLTVTVKHDSGRVTPPIPMDWVQVIAE